MTLCRSVAGPGASHTARAAALQAAGAYVLHWRRHPPARGRRVERASLPSCYGTSGCLLTLSDSMATLKGFPLDRLNWACKNSHRLDIVRLRRQQTVDATDQQRPNVGHRVHGKVLPVENRHFSHWNASPWNLDYHGDGRQLSSGTVFLLPYYMGLYHGFIRETE